MATIYWTATTGSPALASTPGNWLGGVAPTAGDVARFNSTRSNYDCTWDIGPNYNGTIYVEGTYTGTIDLDVVLNMKHEDQGPVFGGILSTINTNDFDVTWDKCTGAGCSGYYFTPAGIINWGDSDLTIDSAWNAGGAGTMNIGAGTFVTGDDFRFGGLNVNITGDATIGSTSAPKPIGGGIWDMNGASPSIICSRRYNQVIQIDDPGTSTWTWQLNSNDSDTWNLGSGSFYNFTVDDTNNNQETATFVGGPAGPLDFPLKIDSNLRIEGNTVKATSYTKLVLHCEGANDGTVFNDSSGRLHTVTANGDVHTDTSVKKFGTASAQFDGDGDYLTIPANGDWDVGTGDFTFDCWAYLSDSDGAGYLLETRNGSYGNNFSIYHSGLNLVFYSQGTDTISATSALTLDTWHHIALVRDGSDVELFVDGVSVGTGTDANDYQGLAPIIIGSRYTFEHYWTGYMDEIRFSKGVARWDAAFTPETSAYAFVPSVQIGNDLLGFDNDAGTSAGKLDLTSGSMELKAGADINTGFTLEGAEGWTRIGGQWSNGGGTFNNNSGTVYLAGNYNKDWVPYNLIMCNRFWNSPAAYVWKNESTPFIYVQNTLTVENDFIISGTYARMQNYDAIVGGNMVVGVEGGGTDAASGSGWCFDGNNQVHILTVSGNMDVWEDAYVGNSGYDYGGARGVGTIGANNERRGTIIVEGYVGVWGDMAANSGSSTGDGNYWDFGCLHIGDGTVYAPIATGSSDAGLDINIYVGAYGEKGRNHAQDVYNNTGSGRFHHNSGTLKNHNDNQTTRIYGGDYTNGPLWNYSLKALNLGNGHYVYDAGEDWVIQNDLTVDSALFYPLRGGIVGGDVLCQDSTGGGITFFDNAWPVTVSGNFTMNKGAGLARFRNPTINLYGNFINNGGTWY